MPIASRGGGRRDVLPANAAVQVLRRDIAFAKLSGGASYVPGAGPTFSPTLSAPPSDNMACVPSMDRVFRYLLVQSDVLDLDKGVVFRVVLPVSYLPGAGYCWKYLVPKKLFPLLLLPRPPVPKTGRGMALLGRHRACRRASFVAGPWKASVGLSEMRA